MRRSGQKNLKIILIIAASLLISIFPQMTRKARANDVARSNAARGNPSVNGPGSPATTPPAPAPAVAPASAASASKTSMTTATKSAFTSLRPKLESLIKTDKMDDLIKECTALINANPNNAEAYYFRAYGRKFRRQTQEFALTDIDKAIAINPNMEQFYGLKAAILHAQQEDELALPIVDKAYKMAPEDWEVVDTKAQILNTLHKPAEALKLADLAVQHMPGVAQFHYTRAQTFIQLGRIAEAEKELDQTIKYNPILILYRQDRIVVSSRLQKWDKMLQDADYVLAHSKYRREAFAKRGDAHIGLKQYTEAIADYKQAINETHSDSQMRVMHVKLKQAFELAGDTRGIETEKEYLKKLDEDMKPL